MATFNVIKGMIVFEYSIAIFMFYKTISDNNNILYIKFRRNYIFQHVLLPVMITLVHCIVNAWTLELFNIKLLKLMYQNDCIITSKFKKKI